MSRRIQEKGENIKERERGRQQRDKHHSSIARGDQNKLVADKHQ